MKSPVRPANTRSAFSSRASRIAVASLLASIGSLPHLQAQTNFFWDADGNSSPFVGGTGAWNSSDSLWRSGSLTGTLGTWTSATNNSAFLVGTPGVVTLGGNLTLNQLHLLSSGYTVAQGAGTTITLGGASGTTGINSIGSNTVGAVLAGSSGLTKLGSGTVTLTGANTFTGGINVRSGGLTVDMSQGGSVANQALTLGNNNDAGGTFTLRGASSGTSALTLGTLTFGGDYGSKVIVDRNGGTGTTLTIGNIVRGVGSQILFDLSSGGTVQTAGQWNGTTQTANAFVSAYFGVRTGATQGDLAVFDAQGRITRLNASTALPTSGGSTTGDYLVSGNTTLSGATSARSIRFNNNSGTPLTLNVGAGNLSSTSSNLTFITEGTGDVVISGNASTTRLNTTSGQQTNFWTFGSGTTTVNLDLTNNSQTIKMGSGLLVVTAIQSSSQGSAYRIMDGVLRQTSTQHSISTKVNSGGVFEVGNKFVAGEFDYSPTNFVFGATNNGGTAGAGGGDGGLSAWVSGANGITPATRVVALSNNQTAGGIGGSLTWGGSGNSFVGNGAALILGSAFSNATLRLVNPINLNNDTREIRVNNGVFSGDVDGELSGVISSTTAASGAILKTGTGTLALTGANTFTGGLFIAEGQVNIGNGGNAGSIATNVTNNGVLGFNRSDALTYAGVISGSGSVRQLGTGVTTLTGAHTYTGGTTVSSGGLLVNGTLASGVTVSGGTLGGSGTIHGATLIQSGGILAPGNSPGTLTFGNGLTLAGTYLWELGGLSTEGVGTNFDQIRVTGGAVDLTGASLSLSLGDFAPSADAFWTSNRSWAILDATGASSVAGTFAITNDQSVWSEWGSFSTVTTSTGVDLQWSAIPEPSAFAGLAGLGALGFAALRRRRR